MTNINDLPCVERAIELWALLFSLLPIPYAEKVCRIRWKPYQTRRASLNQVLSWFIDRELNIGVVTGAVSRIVVLDTDSPAAEEWAITHLPKTPWQVETRKGRHRYFRHPGGEVRNRARVVTPDGQLNLDVRGDGGYVLAPGSVHPSGCRYLAEGDWSVPLEEIPVFDEGWFSLDGGGSSKPESSKESSLESSPSLLPPEPLFESEVRKLAEHARSLLAKMPPAIQGQGGDSHTYRVACILVKGYGLPFQVALELFREWNKRCLPPWAERDLLKKLNNALKYSKGPIGSLRPPYLKLFGM